MWEPKITKVVLNIGLKEAVTDKGVLAKASEQLAAIAGQKPKVTRVKTSIANFKVRAGDPVGLTVTLRGRRMQDFVTKLITIVLPRVRDFHGVPTTSFDKKGNYTLGLTEQIVFPEIDYAKIDKIRGLEITLVNNAGTPELAKKLLESLGMPFKKG
ncbi:MAG: 50S ribosomal protein L5 [Patescibacteria group bacterium]